VGINIKMKCTGRKRGFKQMVYFILIYESKNYVFNGWIHLRTNPKIYEHKLMKLEMGLTVVPNLIFITDLLKRLYPELELFNDFNMNNRLYNDRIVDRKRKTRDETQISSHSPLTT
jgi:hypothetical protein